jgi:hypothetical protein
MASQDMMMIVVMVMMMSSVFSVLAAGGFLLNKPEEGDVCEGPSVGGNYVIDEDGKCILDYCDSGYTKSGGRCVVDAGSDTDTGAGADTGADTGAGGTSPSSPAPAPTPAPAPAPAPSWSATIHNDCHYSETSVGGGVAKNEIPDGSLDIGWFLSPDTVGNDAVSSIQLAPGKAALLYKDNLEGKQMLLENSHNCLVGTEWNDVISGMVVFDSDSVATFYEHCDYTGESIKLGAGDYTPKMLSGMEDRISSIRVPAGRTVTVWRNGDFNGPSASYTSDVACLNPGEFNDSISAIRIS